MDRLWFIIRQVRRKELLHGNAEYCRIDRVPKRLRNREHADHQGSGYDGPVSLGRSTALSESLFAIHEIGCPLLILL